MLVAGSTKSHNDAIHIELADPRDHIDGSFVLVNLT